MKKLTPATIENALQTKLRAYPPARQKSMWKNTGGRPGAFKNALTTHLLTNQSRRCAYCGTRLNEDRPARDHIAPQDPHAEFTFIPANLVLACFYCNTECKWTTDTITVKNAAYENCTFSIIHPYFDEPTDHIQFVGGDNAILVQVVAGSQKGETTVNLFRLASPDRTKQRAKDVMFDDDLHHFPGPWREAFRYVAQSPLRPKLRTA